MNQPRTALALSLAALMASPLAAQTAQTAPIAAPLPPILPWTGASEALIVKPSDPWITPIEQTGFVDTPDYAATRAWLDRLDAASDLVSITPFGTSAEGRALYYVKASKGGARKPGLDNDMAQFAAIGDLELQHIAVPTLLVQGRVDTDVLPGHSEFAAARIAGAQLQWVERGGHLAAFTDPDSDAIQARIVEFLNRG